MAEENIFDFQIHYFLNQEDLHQMDAKILNECERQLLDAFDFIKAYTGEFNIDVIPKKEGGLIETFVISFVASNIGYDIIKNFFNALIQKFFSSTQTKLSNSIDRIKILEKIKNGTITKEEVMALVDDKKLKNLQKKYFQILPPKIKQRQQEPQFEFFHLFCGKDMGKFGKATIQERQLNSKF